jgi:predicted signal transduction protein with EAL and GGDEF domain
LSFLSSLFSVFVVSEENKALNEAQLRMMSRQVPYQYFVVVANTLALAYTHYGIAPDYLTLSVPMLLVLAAIVRSIVHYNSARKEYSSEQIRKRLQNTIYIAFVMGASFTCWALSLYPYGDAYLQVHIALYGAITGVGIVACIMPLRGAAITILLAVFLPFVIFFVGTGEKVFIAVAFSVSTVGIMIAFVSSNYFKDFAALINYQAILVAKEAETQSQACEH